MSKMRACSWLRSPGTKHKKSECLWTEAVQVPGVGDDADVLVATDVDQGRKGMLDVVTFDDREYEI